MSASGKEHLAWPIEPIGTRAPFLNQPPEKTISMGFSLARQDLDTRGQVRQASGFHGRLHRWSVHHRGYAAKRRSSRSFVSFISEALAVARQIQLITSNGCAYKLAWGAFSSEAFVERVTPGACQEKRCEGDEKE